ncbi:carboxypeptidase-like regulatory domain-containing protein [Seonamhaeicola marinus]|uniref:Carboxypeptidase-like regulatory domain-containing protein n=1 Tax=Seonamhaeicola marinus TaxID=1912246 RepID=A0A5D0I4W9_9FLAO|nr:carboxypeptidase-like regulatory domain-containing protein [Seonamhaeicola marinus]TYA78775.1 carboxypeptidase-like regulatory domain-containing protein [Seonamhaeicola marinus]
MKRILYTAIIAIIVCFQVNAQKKIEVNGVILDEFNEPIPYVAVGIVEKYIGTASTEDGGFSFLITPAELQDSLSVSSLGYDPYKIKVADYLNLEKKEIILKETVTELNEITLLSPKDYVLNALKALRDNTLSQPHKLELLYRRAAEEDGKAKFFVENFIKIRDRGPAYQMGAVEVSAARKSADYRYWKRTQWRHSIHDMFHVNPLRPNDSQHARNLKKFTYKKTGDSSYEGEDVVIIEGRNPKLDWEKMTFYIGVDTYKVYKIERGRSLYVYKKHKTGKMVLSYFKNEWSFPKHMVPRELQGTIAETLRYKTEAFIFSVETNKKKMRIVPFGVDKDMGSLDLKYNANFWKNLSMPPDTKFYTRIKNELEGLFGVPLEKQYELVNK